VKTGWNFSKLQQKNNFSGEKIKFLTEIGSKFGTVKMTLKGKGHRDGRKILRDVSHFEGATQRGPSFFVQFFRDSVSHIRGGDNFSPFNYCFRGHENFFFFINGPRGQPTCI